MNYANVVQLVRKSVRDVNHRQRNVVVSGLTELEGVDDAETFTKLCEVGIGQKPMLQREATRRLGKSSGVGPRKLLVRLGSEDAAMELIKAAKRLRNSKDPYTASKVFINPDLTKEEAKQAYERRQHRRQTSSNASGIGVDGAGQSMMEGRSVATGLTSS